MTPDLAAVRDQLTGRLEILERRATKIEGDLRQPGDRDSGEQATERENDEVLEQLEAIGLAELDDLRAAIARIDDGTYSTCEACGDPIDVRRLEALPITRRCIGCAS